MTPQQINAARRAGQLADLMRGHGAESAPPAITPVLGEPALRIAAKYHPELLVVDPGTETEGASR